MQGRNSDRTGFQTGQHGMPRGEEKPPYGDGLRHRVWSTQRYFDPPTCFSCGEELDGEYCERCGCPAMTAEDAAEIAAELQMDTAWSKL